MVAKRVSIGFVGGGRGAHAFLQMLVRNPLVEILFVCDRNPNAVGAAFAAESGVRVVTEVSDQLLGQSDFVFDLTGVPKVAEMLRSRMEPRKIIDQSVAHFMYSVLAENTKEANKQIEADVGHVHASIVANTTKTREILESIKDIASELKIVSLNMSVEAARMGSQAAGFTVIASKVQESVGTVKTLADEIEKNNEAMSKAIGEIEAARSKLNSGMDALQFSQ